MTCAGGGIHHDRDENAAINIEAEGLRILAARARGGLHPEETWTAGGTPPGVRSKCEGLNDVAVALWARTASAA